MGYASAMGWVLFLLILILTAVVLRCQAMSSLPQLETIAVNPRQNFLSQRTWWSAGELPEGTRKIEFITKPETGGRLFDREIFFV